MAAQASNGLSDVGLPNLALVCQPNACLATSGSMERRVVTRLDGKVSGWRDAFWRRCAAMRWGEVREWVWVLRRGWGRLRKSWEGVIVFRHSFYIVGFHLCPIVMFSSVVLVSNFKWFVFERGRRSRRRRSGI